MLHPAIIADVCYCFQFQQNELSISTAVIFSSNETDGRRNNRHCIHGRVIYPIILRWIVVDNRYKMG